MNKKATLKGSVGLLVFSLVLVFGFRWIGFEPYVIPSGSMIPTLLVNDHIVVNKSAYGVRWPFSSQWVFAPSLPERGDVVVFRSVEKDDYYMVKRVVGLPGDRVEFTSEGELKINGERVRSEEISINSEWGEDDLGDSPVGFRLLKEKLGDHDHEVLLEKDGYRYSQAERIIPAGRIFLMGDNRDRSRDSRFWGELPIENLLGRAVMVWLSCSHTLSKANFICDPRYIRWQRFFHHIE